MLPCPNPSTAEETRVAATPPPVPTHPSAASDPNRLAHQVVAAVSTAVQGKADLIRTALMITLAGGHLLLEDVPGVGKTALAKALGTALGGRVRRIQCTPDLLPSDITGSSVYNQRTGEFEFHPGPIFANVVIADEINRAEPKTQSALLECMGEHQVTADGHRYKLPAPFTVVATQNPSDMQGTFPLPEAQRDRFMARLSVGYPTPDDEQAIVMDPAITSDTAAVSPVTTSDEVAHLITTIPHVAVQPAVAGYLVNLVSATRTHPDLALGASTRAAVHLGRAARAHAAMQGHTTVTPDDIKAVAALVLPHRLILAPHAVGASTSTIDLVQQLLTEVPSDGQIRHLAARHQTPKPPRAKGQWR